MNETVTIEDVALRFMLHAIQDWGQTEASRIAAINATLTAAGFNAKAENAPVFGSFLRGAKCSGDDAAAASKFLETMTAGLRRGEFDDEVRQIAASIESARAAHKATA